MYRFLVYFGAVLPCHKCRRHYAAHLRGHVSDPFGDVLSSRESLSVYLVELHNDVNRRLGKPEMPYVQVKEMYVGGSENGDAWAVWVIICIVILSIFAFLVARRRRK